MKTSIWQAKWMYIQLICMNMKRRLTLVMILSLGMFISQAQEGWFKLTVPTNENLNSVCFVDANTGWVVGGTSRILHTSNGGTSWTTQTAPAPTLLQSVYFLNNQVGYTCGNSGRLFKTSNGGTTWTNMTTGTTNHLNKVFFVNTELGFACGDNGTIIYTYNGGTNWFPLNTGTTVKLTDIHFTSTQRGWVAGLGGTILNTTDGGTTWTPQTSGTTEAILSLFFADSLTGYATYSDKLLKQPVGAIPGHRGTWVLLLLTQAASSYHPDWAGSSALPVISSVLLMVEYPSSSSSPVPLTSSRMPGLLMTI